LERFSSGIYLCFIRNTSHRYYTTPAAKPQLSN
jgi:hypothetical protein